MLGHTTIEKVFFEYPSIYFEKTLLIFASVSFFLYFRFKFWTKKTMNVLDNYTDNNNLISIDIDFKMSVLFPNLKKKTIKIWKRKKKKLSLQTHRICGFEVVLTPQPPALFVTHTAQTHALILLTHQTPNNHPLRTYLTQKILLTHPVWYTHHSSPSHANMSSTTNNYSLTWPPRTFLNNYRYPATFFLIFYS